MMTVGIRRMMAALFPGSIMAEPRSRSQLAFSAGRAQDMGIESTANEQPLLAADRAAASDRQRNSRIFTPALVIERSQENRVLGRDVAFRVKVTTPGAVLERPDKPTHGQALSLRVFDAQKASHHGHACLRPSVRS